jgi:hypothetical protein
MWADFRAREINMGHQSFQIEEFKGEIMWLTSNEKLNYRKRKVHVVQLVMLIRMYLGSDRVGVVEDSGNQDACHELSMK